MLLLLLYKNTDGTALSLKETLWLRMGLHLLQALVGQEKEHYWYNYIYSKGFKMYNLLILK